MDARVKIALLLFYIVALFLIETWAGLALAICLAVLELAVSRVGVRMVLRLMTPAFVLGALLIVFNCFAYAPAGQLIGSAEAAPLLQIAGPICLSVEGLERGVFFALRVSLLVLASLVVALATTSTELTAVAAWCMAPLRPLKLPVDDIATVFSIALRFIPLMAEEFCRIRNAQWSRGCGFEDENLVGRVRAWSKVLTPMIMSLFRRADELSIAMDARCYGAVDRRSALVRMKMDAFSAVSLGAGLAICILLAYFL